MTNELLFTQSLFFRNLSDEFNSDLRASIIGYEQCNKNKPIIDSNKSCYVFHFVIHGSGYIYTNKKLDEVHGGECFVITPNSHIKYRPNPKNPWEYIWIELNGNMITKIYECLDLPAHNMHIDISNNLENIIELLNQLFDESEFIKNSNAETLRINSILLRVFSYLIEQYGIEKHSPLLSKKEIQIKKIIEYIDNNYTSATLSVKKIADYFYFDQAYLTRIFKKNMGMSPMKYIVYLRMERALELIKKQTFSISQIAYAVGYKNQFYFSKEFKQYFGMSPSKYLSSIIS